MRRRYAFLLLLPVAFSVCALAQFTRTPDALLRKEFANPPSRAKLRCYWWWLNGNTTEETVRDLTEMSRKGFGGVLLVDANRANQNGNENVPPGRVSAVRHGSGSISTR